MVNTMNENKIQTKLQQTLMQEFGFEDFKPGQDETLTSLVEGHSTLAILPTGTGKSLCYQLYGKFTHQRILIISPLISLMQDQVEQMKYSGISQVVALTSKLTGQERDFVLHNLANYQFIFASPEILQNELIFNQIQRLQIGLLVVDEAHCIAKWGPDFRPDYLILGKIRQLLGQPLTLALTATATPDVEMAIKKQLRFEDDSQVIRYSIDRPNIFLNVEEIKSEAAKNDRLLELVTTIQGPGLIYFSSKKKADEIVEFLSRKTSLRVAAYHADLNLEDRFSIQHQFIENQLDVICATSAFGMGVNKKDIRYVIHYHLPADLESYVQEIGRAGRDGQQSIAILLYVPGDESLQYTMQIDSAPQKNEIDYYYHHPELLKDLQDENHQFLKAFINTQISLPRLESFFTKHRQDKSAALNQMIAYIHTDQCKRQFILDAFKENRTVQHNEKCCQSGPVDVALLGLEKQGQTEPKSTIKMQNYRQVLAELFAQEK